MLQLLVGKINLHLLLYVRFNTSLETPRIIPVLVEEMKIPIFVDEKCETKMDNNRIPFGMKLCYLYSFFTENGEINLSMYFFYWI